MSRLHGLFGSEKSLSYSDTRADNKPYNPQHLRYEVFGPPGTVALISYYDDNGAPQHVDGVNLPWSLEFAMTAATGMGSVAAQGDSDSIGCRILMDGVVKVEKISSRSKRLYLLHAEALMSNHQLQNSRPLVARTIRRFSVAIILAWLAIIGVLNFCVPPLEQVEHEHSVSLSPTDAPSITASQRLNEDFKVSGINRLPAIWRRSFWRVSNPSATMPTSITIV